MADEKDNKKSPPRAPQPPSTLPVVNQLSEGNKVAVAQEKGISDLNLVVSNLFDATMQGTQHMIDHLGKILNIQESQFALQQDIQRQAYERWLEEQRAKKGEETKKPTDAEGDKKDPANAPLGFMTGLAIVLGALAAEMAGLDAAIRAVALPKIFKSFKTGISSFANTLKNFDFKAFKKNILLAFGVGEDGKKIVVQGYKGLFRRPLLGMVVDAVQGVFNAVDNLTLSATGTSLTDILKNIGNIFDNIKNGVVRQYRGIVVGTQMQLDLIKQSDLAQELAQLPGLIAEKFKTVRNSIMASVTAFTQNSDFVKNISGMFDNLPSTRQLKNLLPKGTGEVLESLRTFIGSFDEGTGMLGFFGKALDFLKPLMKPFEFVLKTVMRPFTQIVFTIIDFVTGFYEGFTSTEGSLLDKVGAGLEGGIKGIIKGITEAVDLIFVSLPAWFLEQLGFEKAAEGMREFSFTELVDPIWDAIKKFFKTLFSGDIMGAGSMVVGGINDFIKALLRMVLPDPTEDYGLLDPRTYARMAIPDSIYTYAGINPATGELLEKKIEPKDTGKGSGGAAGAKAIDQVKMVPLPGSMSPMTDNSQVAVTTVNRAGDKQITYVQKSWQQPMPLKPSSAGMDY
jgi:hypothetical protein